MKQTRYWSLSAKLAYYTDFGGPDDCWPWLGHRDRGGYGRLQWQGKDESVARLTWKDERGEIPDGLHALHRCDNRACRNLTHLFLGTNADNVADKTAKGRARKPNERGENNPLAKLTQMKADEIRALAGKQRDIAAQFGVSQRLVGKIKRGEIWLGA